MSMYVHLLSSALERWVDELPVGTLLAYARQCQDAVASPVAWGPTRCSERLAAEIAYDRALVRLGRAVGIAVDASWFCDRVEARRRLEERLAAAGLDVGGDAGGDSAGAPGCRGGAADRPGRGG